MAYLAYRETGETSFRRGFCSETLDRRKRRPRNKPCFLDAVFLRRSLAPGGFGQRRDAAGQPSQGIVKVAAGVLLQPGGT